jgi:zinc and cadmium transporter
VLDLTIHTFMNGVGLAGAVQADVDAWGLTMAPVAVLPALPGLALFLAVVLHKPAGALAMSTVLGRKGVSPQRLGLGQLGFALMVPAGAIAVHLTRGAIAKDLQSKLTGAPLAFSAGTFQLIALSNLLPEGQFHRHDRVPLFLTLLFGVVLMGGSALPEDHEHGEHGDATAAHTGQAHDSDHKPHHYH